MKYIKFIINDTIFIDDITENTISISYNKNIYNYYIPRTIYINRFNGEISNLEGYNVCLLNNFKLIENNSINLYNNTKTLLYKFYLDCIKSTNRINIDKIKKYNLSIVIPVNLQIVGKDTIKKMI